MLRIRLTLLILVFAIFSIQGKGNDDDSKAIDEAINNNDGDDHKGITTPNGKKKHHHHHWGYKNDGDNEWTKETKKCGGIRQSPINIESSKVRHMREFHEIIFNVHRGLGGAVLVNNGHTASITFDDKIEMVWENLENPYTVHGIHFHWGKYDGEGSEHRLDGRPYPLELHIVTYNSERYGTISDALGHKDSLSVYGVLFELSESDNNHLVPIVNVLANVSETKEKVHINGLNLKDLLPNNYGTRYLTYSGSLTTPPCSESVVWILGDNKLSVSSKQLKEFRKLFTHPGHKLRAAALLDHSANHGSDDKILFNWRRPQDIHKRVVHASFPQLSSLELRNDPSAGERLREQTFVLCLCLFLFSAFIRAF